MFPAYQLIIDTEAEFDLFPAPPFNGISCYIIAATPSLVDSIWFTICMAGGGAVLFFCLYNVILLFIKLKRQHKQVNYISLRIINCMIHTFISPCAGKVLQQKKQNITLQFQILFNYTFIRHLTHLLTQMRHLLMTKKSNIFLWKH